MPGGFRKDGSVDLRKLPRIVRRALGRHKADGLASHYFDHEFDREIKYAEPTIEIDIGLTGARRLEIVIHETLHLVFPWMSETLVTRSARYIARVLWKNGVRFQDESEHDS